MVGFFFEEAVGIPSGMVIECHGLEVCGAGLATKWVRALGSRLPGVALSLQRPGTGFQTQVSKGPEALTLKAKP